MSADGDFHRSTVNIARALAAYGDKEDCDAEQLAYRFSCAASLAQMNNKVRMDWLFGEDDENPERFIAFCDERERLQEAIFSDVTIVYAL